MRTLLRRDLGIVLRARTTWWLALVSAVLIGHGFSGALQRVRLGDVRPLDPMLRGLYIALCICGPVVAARALSREKERRTFHALILQTRSIPRVLLSKWLSATLGVLLPWTVVIALLGLWRGTIGEIDVPTVVVPLIGYAIYSCYVAAVGVAAASLTHKLRGAVFLAWFTIAWNAAIDASDSVPLLAFMQRDKVWSPGTYLAIFERGQVAFAAVGWLLAAISTGFVFGWVGCRFDIRGRRRFVALVLATLMCGSMCLLASELPGSWDVAPRGPETR